ncbi:leucine-rich repeat domain-containing protein [Legionella drozanskii]|uniref:Leucine-rich repeat domain-containing protein n=2 Tax=Legionella TaxID=445 RepID=A0A0W0SV42_9GAMM|nr:leucine-rich repeat domain-containing protein [Legionella drozanskii]KTC87153.1 hypothetical protein Ldro_1825 [Legionella drozanskii LLAP-1]
MLLSHDGSTLLEVNENDIKNGFFEIPIGVTIIGRKVFSRCVNLQQITIPEGVSSIPRGAFSWCSNLQQINIPESVTSIGDEAFLGCQNLQQITIPESVTSIGDKAFAFCHNLLQINIPESVTSFGDSAFLDCRNLQQITIPEGVISIGRWTFAQCKSLKQITIPDSVTSIGDEAFERCESLQQIIIPENITSIGAGAFNYCKNLQSILINGFDESKRERIIQLMPEDLRNKVVIYSGGELTKLWDKELRRITNAPEANPLYSRMPRMVQAGLPELPNEVLVKVNQFVGSNNVCYKQALAAIKDVPLPIIQDGKEGKQAYETKIKNIVDNCIRHGQPSDPNNYSFLLNALTATAAIGALALTVAALVTALVITSPYLSISLLAVGVVCGVAAAGTFFYRSCAMPKDEPVCVYSSEESAVPG